MLRSAAGGGPRPATLPRPPARPGEASDSSESTSSRGLATGEETTSSPRASSRTESGRSELRRPSASRSWVAHDLGQAASATCRLVGRLARASRAASLRTGQSPSRPRTKLRRPPRPRSERTSRTLGRRSDQREHRGDGGVVDLVAACCGDELDAGAAERQLARAVRSSLRTRPAMRLTTSRKSTADATMSTSTSGLSICLGEADAGRDQARAARGARGAAASGACETSSAGSSSVRIEGCRAAAPQSR